MTIDEMMKLREAWNASGRPPCEHVNLELVRSHEGCPTGGYVCLRCGQEVLRRRPPNGFGLMAIPPI